MSKSRLNDKVIVVSGSARGIGQAIACRFAEEGATLILVDIADSSDTLHRVQRVSPNSRAFRVDVSDEQAVQQLAAEVQTGVSQELHGLVASHAAFVFHSVETATSLDWTSSFRVNVLGSALLIKAFLPLLKRARASSVVLLGSISSFMAQPSCATYAITKAALVQLARSCAYDLSQYGVRCNALCPGCIETPISAIEREAHRLSYDAWQKLKTADVILDRVGTVQEVANAALFLISDESSYITATALMVDGGAHACTVRHHQKSSL